MSAADTIVRCITESLGRRIVHPVMLLLSLLVVAPQADALIAQTITGFAPSTPITYSTGKTFTLSATGGGSGKPVVFASSTTAVCTVAGNKASVLGVGTCALTANQAGSATYSAAPQVRANVVINKGSQTITFGALAGKSFGTAPFTIVATASSGLAVTLTSTTATVCSVAGATVTLVKVGTCTIAANQAGNGNFNAAAQVAQSFAVSKGSQTITLGVLAGRSLGTAPFTIAATASSGLAVAFTSAATTICTVSGSTVTLVRVGTCTIAANQAGNTNYNAAAQVTQSFAVTALAAQTITGFAPATPLVYSAGLTFVLSATGGASGNPVTFASTTSAVCTVAGNVASVAAAGTCALKADQAGNASYSAAPQVTATVTINKASQTITFGALPPVSLGAVPFIVAATASSGLAVAFTSATTTICTISGAVVTLVKVGTCTIRANQAGNANFSAAAQVAQSFAVQPAVLGATITSPLNHATFTAPATIPIVVKATAPSGQAVARLDYWRNGFWIGSDVPGSLYTFTNLPVGTHTFVVIANDTNGNSASSAPVAVTVVPPPQAVLTALTSPANGATYMAPATIALVATASAIAPASSIRRVDFYRGSTLLGSSTAAPFAYTWTGAPVGRHAVTAVATDNLGATGTSAAVYATVDGGDTCDSTPPLGANDAATRIAALDRLPITFEENAGQADAAVRFMARAPGFQFFLTDSERVMVLRAPSAASPRRSRMGELRASADAHTAAVRLRFVGANPHPAMTGSGPLEQRSHYLLGDDPARWHTNVRHFAQARYHDIYPGIDEVYSSRQGKLEYDLHVAPGADPRAIRLALGGVERLAVDASGDLLLETALGTLVQKKPVAYQDIAGERRAVAASYRIAAANEVSFALGDYDTAFSLVIDPVLSYSTLLGGTYGGTAANGIALSRCGEAYLVGSTYAQDLPTTTTALDPVGIPVYAVTKMGFVAKLNAAGSGLLYSTYLTGTWSNVPTEVNAVAVDATGHAFVAGNTYAEDFPTTPGSAFPTMPASIAGFVAKLNSAGSGLVYSTYLPGAQIEAVAIDSTGSAYVAGGSNVWKVNATGDAVDYDVSVGGSGPASAQAIAVDAAGNAYVAGITVATDLPVTSGAFQSSKPGAGDAGFVSKINPAGSGLVYSTYLGATTPTEIFGLALDAAGNAHVAGRVATGGTVPNLGGNFVTFNQGVDVPSNVYAFAAKLDAAGRQLAYFSRVGGSSCTNNSCFGAETWANAVAVDQNGKAWITGLTGSNQIPLVKPFVSQFNAPGNGPDIFAAQLTPEGNSLAFSTLLGGHVAIAGANYADPSPRGAAIAVDPVGSVYVAGTTNRSDFPTTPGALQATLAPGSGFGAFVVKMNDSRDTSTTLTASPSPGLVGSPVVLTATIDGNAPTGTVTFFEGTTVLGAAMIATAAAPFTAAVSLQFSGGSHSLSAVYAGDAHNTGSTSALITLSLSYPPAPSVPGAPTLTGATPGTGRATLSFAAPTSDGGSAITGYTGTCNAAGQPTATVSGAANATTIAVTGMAAGTAYGCTVSARNSLGTGPASNSVNVTPTAAPSVAITAPANNAVVGATSQVAIVASVQVAPATVSRIEIHDGATLLTSFVPPGGASALAYTYSWRPSSLGSHALSARVIDSTGTITASSVVTVTAFFPPSATLDVAANFFLAPADIDLYAAAAGTASISKVELFSGTTLLATLTAAPYNYRWSGVANGSYTLTARATDSLGLSSDSAPVTVTVGSGMAIVVDAGVDGSTVQDDTISFAGALQAPANSAVDVNGRPGVVTLDGRFFFNSLPLQPGSNALTIRVTNIDGQTATQNITINSAGQAPFVLSAGPVKSFPPLAAAFTLANRGNVAFKRIELSCNDNGVISLTAATIAAFNGSTCTFNTTGNGKARVNVIGQVEGQAEQVIFTATQSLYSIPVVAMDRMLRGVYADMLGRLKAGNVALALNAVTAGVRDQYNAIFGGIANLAAAVDQIGTIEQGTINDRMTEYLVVRKTVAGDTGHFIYLMPGEDGIWRIDGM